MPVMESLAGALFYVLVFVTGVVIGRFSMAIQYSFMKSKAKK